ncbi:hypothetical protein CSH63_24910 [Micromonospora tulbaghiae]|uniref:Uncharacterized protein n=1 Tax=Micromonospora tulbaghiae TaxID=479978 RepID=A0A386WQE8_9ACTN|nr:hypothetical protein [Micromonospora tulbaghiae]AYF30625.1 hypothetical protein CSH63_24910 [Micromonospora tulbaghiae]
MADGPADTSFTTALADLEHDQLHARAATAEQERDEARDDRDAARRERNEWEQTAAQLGKQLDEMCAARDVLRAQLTTHKATIKALNEQVATAHNALRNLAQAYTDATGTTPPPPVLGSSPRAQGGPAPAGPAEQGIRPPAWEQHATDAVSAALAQTWSWSDRSVMPARIAEVAVRAIVDAGLAGPGGRCPTCGATYPRTLPAGEDQRCWTCSTQEVVGLPEYAGSAVGPAAAPGELPEYHWGRAWSPTQDEATCPCPKAPCGYVVRSSEPTGCELHGPMQTMRGGHPADRCPGRSAEATAVSSVIAVPSRFARAAGAAHGQNDTRDWVRLPTGSGRQYEGHRSLSCPGDGVAGHRHDVRCVDQAEG